MPELSQRMGRDAADDGRTFSDRSTHDERILPEKRLTRLASSWQAKTPATHAVQPVFLYAHPVTNKPVEKIRNLW